MSTSHTIPIAVSARNLSKTYAGESPVQALRNISIDFERGKFTAIMGPSGSGKSTLLHTLATLDAPDPGEQTSVQVKGVELTGLKDAALAEFRARNIGFIFQAFNLIPTLTAAQNMELPLGLAKMAVDTIWRDELVRTLGLEDPPQAPALSALRWAAAAGSYRPGPTPAPGRHFCGRTHRRPRLGDKCRGAGASTAGQPGTGADHSDGDP